MCIRDSVYGTVMENLEGRGPCYLRTEGISPQPVSYTHLDVYKRQAIVLALITKEVYSSLFVGIVIGGLFYGNVFQAGFAAERSVLHIFEDGLVGVLSDSDNVGILIFLVVLGVMVSICLLYTSRCV